MTVPAPPAPAEKRPRKSAAGIAPRAAGVLLALLALVMAVGSDLCGNGFIPCSCSHVGTVATRQVVVK